MKLQTAVVLILFTVLTTACNQGSSGNSGGNTPQSDGEEVRPGVDTNTDTRLYAVWETDKMYAGPIEMQGRFSFEKGIMNIENLCRVSGQSSGYTQVGVRVSANISKDTIEPLQEKTKSAKVGNGNCEVGSFKGKFGYKISGSNFTLTSKTTGGTIFLHAHDDSAPGSSSSGDEEFNTEPE